MPPADDRANSFYRDTLALPPAFEGVEHVDWLLGETILMLKPGWYARSTNTPNPRIPIATERARETEAVLRTRGVTISDPVQTYDEFDVDKGCNSTAGGQPRRGRGQHHHILSPHSNRYFQHPRSPHLGPNGEVKATK